MGDTVAAIHQDNFIQLECPECGEIETGEDKNFSRLTEFFSRALELHLHPPFENKQLGKITRKGKKDFVIEK